MMRGCSAEKNVPSSAVLQGQQRATGGVQALFPGRGHRTAQSCGQDQGLNGSRCRWDSEDAVPDRFQGQ